MSKQVETNVQTFKSLKANLSVQHFYPLLLLTFSERKKIKKEGECKYTNTRGRL